jgi:hypothetical protein
MPQPSVRRTDLLSRVGTLLSTSFDTGIPLRDVQEAASHADPRTTMRSTRARSDIPRPERYLYRRCLRRWSSPVNSTKPSIRPPHPGRADQRHRT